MARLATRWITRSRRTLLVTEVDSTVEWTVTDSDAVLRVLGGRACCDALVRVRQLIPAALRGVHDPTPPKRDPEAKWSEATLVDKSLPMRAYLAKAAPSDLGQVQGLPGRSSVSLAFWRSSRGQGSRVRRRCEV